MSDRDNYSLALLVELAADGLNRLRLEWYDRVDQALRLALEEEFGGGAETQVSLGTIGDPGTAPITPEPDVVTRQRLPSRANSIKPMRPSRMVRELTRLGFQRRHGNSKHAVFTHPNDHGGHVAVPRHCRDLPRGTIQNILRQAGRVLQANLGLDVQGRHLVVMKG